ncbi:hypothetical protein [Oryza sativa Japonica Group]|uniref:Uncharacterized protein n=2 Tax=Oryza sativa subsp. japonica TaxID=39947 RepID=Q5ZBA2_ORYSJ|nr:hypothetical protein [Oryza sativa Japonica Group]BAD53201.1 hypothetical protein [Oryza sativa Japonica Group]
MTSPLPHLASPPLHRIHAASRFASSITRCFLSPSRACQTQALRRPRASRGPSIVAASRFPHPWRTLPAPLLLPTHATPPSP